MSINLEDFARDCADQAFRFGVNAHYLLAVAELRSGINDDSEGDGIGPFRIKQADWDSLGAEPKFELTLQPDQIKRPGMQCVFAALQTLRAQEKFLKQSRGRFPSADELFAVWPNEPPPAGKSLQRALSDTASLIETAEKEALDGLDLGTLSDQSRSIGSSLPNKPWRSRSSMPSRQRVVMSLRRRLHWPMQWASPALTLA